MSDRSRPYSRDLQRCNPTTPVQTASLLTCRWHCPLRRGYRLMNQLDVPKAVERTTDMDSLEPPTPTTSDRAAVDLSLIRASAVARRESPSEPDASGPAPPGWLRRLRQAVQDSTSRSSADSCGQRKGRLSPPLLAMRWIPRVRLSGLSAFVRCPQPYGRSPSPYLPSRYRPAQERQRGCCPRRRPANGAPDSSPSA